MDKRTLLALGLSFLVFIAWSLLFGPKPKDKPLDNESVEKKEDIKHVSKDRPAPPAKKTTVFSEKSASYKDIQVDTELYTAVFSGSGPAIKSFKLKKYLSSLKENPVLKELINTKNTDGHGFDLGMSKKMLPPDKLSEFKYAVNRQKISLGADNHPEELIYKWRSPKGIDIETSFLFYPDDYKIDVSLAINNKTEHTINDICALNITHLPENIKKRYGVFEGMAFFANKKLKEINVKKIKNESFTDKLNWVAYEEPYFMKAIVNENTETATVKSMALPDGEIKITYLSEIQVTPGGSSVKKLRMYFGPLDIYILKALHNNLEKAINFGWFDFIAKPLLYTLRFFNRFVYNYGLSIIILTIVIKILFWPLTHKSYQSMKEMRKLQPMMAKIRERYKTDKQEMQKQLMALYKTYKINPMGGCLPMIVQIPVFFALYRVLPGSIELRHAPFMLWIKDLSAPDRLFNFSFHIPFMSPPYGIPVLTLIMGASMFLQQKMTPATGDPAQAKMMMFLPIIFTFLFINFPSGLVLYWLVNNILSIFQQYRINRQVG